MLAPRDLDYFLEVARRGQLGHAAAQLEVTPAALSKAIRRLESELGLPLFERNANGMTLSPFGETFVARAERIQHEHDDALHHAGEVRAGRAGLLRIGSTIAVLETVVSPALARLQPRRPMLRAVLTVASSDHLVQHVRDGQVDAAVVPTYERTPAAIAEIRLGVDALVAVVRAGHPVLRRRRPTLADVAQLAWLMPRTPSAARMQLEAVFAHAGLPVPRAAVEVDVNASWSLSLVASTELVAVVPSSALQSPVARELRVLEVEGLKLARTITLLSRPAPTWSPLMQEFVQALKEGGRRAARQRSAA